MEPGNRFLQAPKLRLTHLDLEEHPGHQLLGQDDAVALSACQAQALGCVPRQVLKRDHAHPHQVAAVDALVAFSNHSLDALKAQ